MNNLNNDNQIEEINPLNSIKWKIFNSWWKW
jgi:hypothetical protein